MNNAALSLLFPSGAVLAEQAVWWSGSGIYGGGVAIISGLLTSIAIWLVWRKFAPLQTAAMDAALKAQNELRTTQSAHIEELKKERDDYRSKLHDVRDNSQSLALRIKELEAQPNLGSITLLLENQSKITEEIVRSFQEHAAADADVFSKFQKLLEKMNDNLSVHREELIRRLPLRRSRKSVTK